jgi:hypothetical protein
VDSEGQELLILSTLPQRFPVMVADVHEMTQKGAIACIAKYLQALFDGTASRNVTEVPTTPLCRE